MCRVKSGLGVWKGATSSRSSDLAGSSNVVLSEPVRVHGFQVGKDLTLPLVEEREKYEHVEGANKRILAQDLCVVALTPKLIKGRRFPYQETRTFYTVFLNHSCYLLQRLRGTQRRQYQRWSFQPGPRAWGLRTLAW